MPDTYLVSLKVSNNLPGMSEKGYAWYALPKHVIVLQINYYYYH